MAEFIKLLSEFGKDEPMTIKILLVITCTIPGSVIVFFANRSKFYTLDLGKLIFLCVTIGICLMVVNYFWAAAFKSLVAVFKGKRSSLDDDLTELNYFKSELDGFKSELNGFRSELEGFKAKLKDFKAKLKDFKAKLKDSKVKLKVFKSELEGFEAKLKNLKSELKDFKLTLDDYFKDEDEKLSIGYILLMESMVLTWCESAIIALCVALFGVRWGIVVPCIAIIIILLFEFNTEKLIWLRIIEVIIIIKSKFFQS